MEPYIPFSSREVQLALGVTNGSIAEARRACDEGKPVVPLNFVTWQPTCVPGELIRLLRSCRDSRKYCPKAGRIYD